MKRISIIGAVALGVTLVWACSSAVEDVIFTPDASAGDPPSESKSGSRLQIRPIVYEGDDGSIIRMGEEIFDTELGVVCELGLAVDGMMRCLPKDRDFEFIPMIFSDAACTKNMLFRLKECYDSPSFVTIYTAPSESVCSTTPSTQTRIGQSYRVSPAANRGYIKVDEACVAYTDEIRDVELFVAEAIDVSELVAMRP